MTYRILSIAIMLSIGINASAQQTDPALVGAVGVQTAMLKDIFSDREKTQQKMQNLYQIKRAAELVTTEIPQNMNLVRKSVPGHLKGTAIALLVSDELTDAATQMASLFPFMKQLVTSGTYNVDGYDSQGNPTTEKHKVNLLNSAERYYVANEVVSKLETINTDLWLLAWQIRTLSWQDLWYGLDPEGWAAVMSGKAIVESLIYEWEYL